VSVGDSLSGDRGGGSVDESLLLASTREHESPKVTSVIVAVADVYHWISHPQTAFKSTHHLTVIYDSLGCGR
jgi:hypothetical protein